MERPKKAKRPQWAPETIRAPGQYPAEGRDVLRYREDMGFELSELEGKKILDLGSSTHARFATSLRENGIHAEVVSLSPDYNDHKFRSALAQADPSGMHVAALGQEMPFPDNTFDVIVSMRLVEHLKDRKEYIAIIKEVIRVLKSGGKAYFSPFIPLFHYDPFIDPKEHKGDPLLSQAIFSLEDIDPIGRIVNMKDEFGQYMGTAPVQRMVVTKK